jgi:hypothetical protein
MAEFRCGRNRGRSTNGAAALAYIYFGIRAGLISNPS